MAAPLTHDSAVLPCFHGCLAFLHRHFPPQSPPSHPLDSSLCSQQQLLPWDCSTIPELQLSATAPSGVCMAVARTNLILIPFRLPQISCSTLSLKYFSSDSDNCPDMGIGPLRQFPHLPRAGAVLLILLSFPLVPLFCLRSFAWFYIFFSIGQVLLSALSWCSACISVSEGVFLIYLWRYSSSTYSSVIFFSSLSFTFINR